MKPTSFLLTVSLAILLCNEGAAWSQAINSHTSTRSVGQLNAAVLRSIPQRMQEFVQTGKTAGVVTLLAQDGQIRSFDAVGFQDLSKHVPMQKTTLFRIASLTKPITCAAVMILADEGKLSVIDPVEKFLPEYTGVRLNQCGLRAGYACQATAPARPIDLEDLLTHTSGLPPSAEAFAGSEPPASLAAAVALGSHSSLLFNPGTQWSYSNLGIDILGRIVELVSGQSFAQFLQDRIFKPLGMRDTFFGPRPDLDSRLATLYKYSDGHLEPIVADWGTGHLTFPSPAGGLISTAEDLFRFNEMMREGGRLDNARVLSQAAVDLMTASHTGDLQAGWSPGMGHGYGYEVVRNVAGTFRYHSLGTFAKGGAYRTFEWVDGFKGLVGIIMMQRSNGGGDTADEINSFAQLSAAAWEPAAH